MKMHVQTPLRKLVRPGWAAIGAALALVLTGISADAQIPGVNVYPAVPGLPASTNYTVRVCAASNPSVWTNVFTFQTAVPANPSGDYNYYSSVKGWSHSYVNFEMTVPVTVEISKVGGTITNAAVHPARKARNVYVSGGKVYLTMDNPCNVAVDIDGQMDSRYTGDGAPSPIHTISIHGNPVLANKPATNDAGVYLVTPGTTPPATGTWTTLYFQPGVHDLGTNFQVYAGKQYYIPGDAIVYATFNNYSNNNGNNISIFGHGTLSGARFIHWVAIDPSGALSYMQRPIDILYGKNIRLEGITLADSANNSILTGSWVPEMNVTNVVSWIKIFTWRPNGDGGGCGANNDVNHCFMRTQDDGLYIQGRRVSENVLWVDVNGAGMRLSQLPNLTSGTLMVDNIDAIYSRHNWWSGSSPLELPEDGGNRGSGVIFSNLNFSDPYPNGPAIAIHQGTNGA
ncbi:MAG: hypothetical protein LUQ69_09700, partial [Methanoregulaceae archaeon]|nr:hypothetical protein [Methanoregulaceae archaeon]